MSVVVVVVVGLRTNDILPRGEFVGGQLNCWDDTVILTSSINIGGIYREIEGEEPPVSSCHYCGACLRCPALRFVSR